MSLLACEHLFGFTGLFLSFPILFVAGRIRGEFLEEDAIVTSASSSIVLSDSPDQLGRHEGVEDDADSPTGFQLESRKIPLDSVRPPGAPEEPTLDSATKADPP